MISHESLQSCYSWYNFYPNNLAVILEVYLWTVFYGLCLTMEANFYTPDLLAYINLAWLSILIYLVYDLVKGEGAPLHVPWINNAIFKKKSLCLLFTGASWALTQNKARRRRGGINPNVSTLQRKLVDFEWSLYVNVKLLYAF